MGTYRVVGVLRGFRVLITGGPDPDPETVRDLVKNDGVATKLDGGERGRLCQVPPPSLTILICLVDAFDERASVLAA